MNSRWSFQRRPTGLASTRRCCRSSSRRRSRTIHPLKVSSFPRGELVHSFHISADRGGRLYRRNIRGDAGDHHLGQIEALLAGTANALKPPLMNEYTLRSIDDGSLFCDLFWDPPAEVCLSNPSYYFGLQKVSTGRQIHRDSCQGALNSLFASYLFSKFIRIDRRN